MKEITKSFRIQENHLKKAEKIAKSRGMKFSEYVRRLIEWDIKDQEIEE